MFCSRSSCFEFISWIFSSSNTFFIKFSWSFGSMLLTFSLSSKLAFSIASILVCRTELLVERSSILACENSTDVRSSLQLRCKALKSLIRLLVLSSIRMSTFHMSEKNGLVSSCSICAAMSDLVRKLTFSSKLLRFVSCFGEVSLFEPLLAFLFFFFLLVALTILSYFHLEKTSRVAELSKARPFTATARPNPYNMSLTHGLKW